MESERILIVDDDDNICQLLTLYLVKEGYNTSICHNGKEALILLRDSAFNVVLLDIMMPEMDGYETLMNIRKFSNVPVIMLSAKGEPMDKISGLDFGADDYVTKPFEPQELISRIKAILRRFKTNVEVPMQSLDKSELVIGDLRVSMSNYIVTVGENKIEMPPKEIELLYHLASNPMQVFARDQLLNKVWGTSHKVDQRTVDVHVKRIRERLGEGKGWRLSTVWGVGYKFEIVK